MTHVIAIAGFALLCAIWVVVQVASGRGPRACKGDGECELDANGEKTCTRSCSEPAADDRSNIVPLPGTRSRRSTR